MSSIGELVLHSMQEELEKEAAFPTAVQGALSGLGSIGGAAMTGGALIGAGLRGTRAYRRAREEGATRGQAFSGSLGEAGRGALVGGGIGAAAGGIGGAAVGALAPGSMAGVRRAASYVPGSKYVQRQVHSLTGWTPTGQKGLAGGLGEIGIGSATRQGGIEAAKAHLQRLESGPYQPKGISEHAGAALAKIKNKILSRTPEDARQKAIEGAKRGVENAQAAFESAKAIEEAGLTSIPGLARGLVSRNAPSNIKLIVNEQLAGQNLPMKALALGLPAYGLGKEVLSPNEVDEQGHSKIHRIAGAAGGIAANTVMSPLTMTTQMVGPSLVAKGVRTGVNKLRRHPTVVPPSTLPENAVGNPTPVEQQVGQGYVG